MVGGLPMDGMAGDPIADWLRARIDGGKHFGRFEYTLVNGGHAWKTNPGDISATFERAGFSGVRVMWRPDHVSRFIPGTWEELVCEKRRRFGKYRALIWPMESAVSALMFGRPARWALKVAFAIEHRLSFGISKLFGLFSSEAVVVGRRRGCQSPRRWPHVSGFKSSNLSGSKCFIEWFPKLPQKTIGNP